MRLLALAAADIGNHQFRDHFGTKAYSHRKVGRLVSEALLTSKVGWGSKHMNATGLGAGTQTNGWVCYALPACGWQRAYALPAVPMRACFLLPAAPHNSLSPRFLGCSMLSGLW